VRSPERRRQRRRRTSRQRWERKWRQGQWSTPLSAVTAEERSEVGITVHRNKDQGRSLLGQSGKEGITCFGDPAGFLRGKNDLHLDSNTFELINIDQKLTVPSRLITFNIEVNRPSQEQNGPRKDVIMLIALNARLRRGLC
jgi:hypothetical protein